MLNAWLMSVMFWGVLIAVFGPALIPFMVIQAVFGFTLMETVNYLEHYGLLRQKTQSGRYERCAPRAQLELRPHRDQSVPLSPAAAQRSPRQPDPALSDSAQHAGAPNLPSGYASMIALTYVPALWRKVMDHRVLEHYDGDITRVNLHPRVRDKVA